MTSALQRLAALFVVPASETGSRAPRARHTMTRGRPAAPADVAAAPALGVLCGDGNGLPGAIALALVVAGRARARCALLCHWTGREPSAPPPSTALPPAARSLAGRLAARDLCAWGRGRLAGVALPADPLEARAAVERACVGAVDVPLVVLVDGPRPAAFDALLASLDRLIVIPPADAVDGLEALAVADAARIGRAIGVLRHTTSAPARLLAGGGLAVAPGLRAAAAAALDGREDA